MTKVKLPKATHQGELNIVEFNIECYNLDNGERVLSRIGFLKALGRTGKAKGGRKYDEEFQTPIFLTASNIKPLITNDIIENSAPVIFTDLNGTESIGYKAELLPDVSYLFSVALDKGLLKPNQIHIGQQSKKLVKGFLKVSITALVDEATGYQYEREKDALQQILKLYVSEEILNWQKTFHDAFYKEIFRLRNWPFTEHGILKRPGVVGTYTNMFIYATMPPGVMEKIKSQTAKSKSGNYIYRFHQSLTPEAGREHLKNQLVAITTLMSVSRSWKEFIELFNRKYRNFGEQLSLDFGEQAEKEKPMAMTAPEFDHHLKGLLAVPPPKKDK